MKGLQGADLGRVYTVPKKVFPLSIDMKERRILEVLSERDGVSMAEAMRRLIRSAALDAMPAKAFERPPAASTDAH